MKIDRDLWTERFYKDEWPQWPCPECGRGILKLTKDSFKNVELISSKKQHDDEDWDIEWYKGSFRADLKCSNDSCGETVFVSGELRVDEVRTYSKRHGHVEERLDQVTPKYCHPALHLFSIPENTPWDIEIAIVNAFALYWSDKSACGNAIRKVVELILNDKSIRKTKITNAGKRKPLLLDERIKLFEAKNQSAAETLMAIKWIGNVGSHDVEIDEEVLFDGLELLEFALEDLYGEAHHKRMASIRKRVIKRKGK